MSRCDHLDLFADGELAKDEADAFSLHLADCAACQSRLEGILYVGAVSTMPKCDRLTDAELDEAFKHVHGSLRLTAALSELRDLRAMRKRLEEWADQLDECVGSASLELVVADLRRRMEGP